MSGRHINDYQMRLFMNNINKHSIATSSAKAGFSQSTGYRIKADPRFPSQKKKPRGSRRPDPLRGLFEQEVIPLLEECKDIQSVGVYHELLRRHPDLDPGIRRTLERRIREWRAEHGADKDVIFPQTKIAGALGISDFTGMGSLDITISGVLLDHKLYHFRLPWSGFVHANVVLGGESYQALAEGLQNALWSLGGVPREHRTDSLSAAFRNLNQETHEDLTRRYHQLCEEYGMTPSRNNRGEAHENGAIESPHGHLKREINDALLLCGSRDFEDLETYQKFIAITIGRINARRGKTIKSEAETLQPLPQRRHDDFEVAHVRVTSSSGFTLRKVFSTVPSRLIGHRLTVHLYRDRLALYLGGSWQMDLERKIREKGQTFAYKVNYRHVIHSLKTKPRALLNLAYRDDLFPHSAYQRCFDRTLEVEGSRNACRLMVKLLALAHENKCERALADVISTCLDTGTLPDLASLRKRFAPPKGSLPCVTVTPSTLDVYGDLLVMGGGR